LLQTIYPQALNEIEETLLRQSNWNGGLIHRHADGRAVMVVGHWYLHRNAEGYDAVVSEVHSDAVGQQLGDLIAVLAHELSQPLAAITSYIDGGAADSRSSLAGPQQPAQVNGAGGRPDCTRR
jgi:signal transduction histidine kinase